MQVLIELWKNNAVKHQNLSTESTHYFFLSNVTARRNKGEMVFMLCYVMLCYVMLCHVMLCYVMSCYVMLYVCMYVCMHVCMCVFM